MNLSEQQIEFISNSLTINGINSEALKEDIVDHICTAIEVETPQNFESIYSRIIQQFGGYYNMKEIQKETTYAAYSKKMLKTRKSMFASAYAIVAILIIGTLFKILHWPFANIIWVTGVLAFVLLCLPLFFYKKYLKSILHTQST